MAREFDIDGYFDKQLQSHLEEEDEDYQKEQEEAENAMWDKADMDRDLEREDM